MSYELHVIKIKIFVKLDSKIKKQCLIYWYSLIHFGVIMSEQQAVGVEQWINISSPSQVNTRLNPPY
jgi:hypothetical protein